MSCYDSTATLKDLHSAASYLAGLLRGYSCEEAGFAEGVGIPFCFGGSWQIKALLGEGEGYEEIICITPASNSHLRKAFNAYPNHGLSCSGSTTSSTADSFLHPLQSPSDFSYFAHPSHHRQRSFGNGNGLSLTERALGEGNRSLELHCHPKFGTPMVAIVGPGADSESGKAVRIDLLQAGEYGPRKLYQTTSDGNSPLWEIHDLPFLSPTEFVRAKIRNRRQDWDHEDIIWFMTNYSEYLDLNRLCIEEVDEFVNEIEDENVAYIWADRKLQWGI